MPLPIDYAKRVYAGVLGKIVGVYLGRPVEGWSYERIAAEIGEIWYYVDQHPAIRARQPAAGADRRRYLRDVHLRAGAGGLRA